MAKQLDLYAGSLLGHFASQVCSEASPKVSTRWRTVSSAACRASWLRPDSWILTP